MDSTELAERYLVGARLNFQNYGALVPIIALHGGPLEMILGLKGGVEGLHPSDQTVLITGWMTALVPVTNIVTVNETWIRQFPGIEDPSEIERGDLEKMHEAGDSAVHTALMVLSIDVKDFETSLMATIDVDEGTAPQYFKVSDGGEGDMPHRIYDAWRDGQIVANSMDPEIKAPSWQELIKFLTDEGFIEYAMVADSTGRFSDGPDAPEWN